MLSTKPHPTKHPSFTSLHSPHTLQPLTLRFSSEPNIKYIAQMSMQLSTAGVVIGQRQWHHDNLGSLDKPVAAKGMNPSKKDPNDSEDTLHLTEAIDSGLV